MSVIAEKGTVPVPFHAALIKVSLFDPGCFADSVAEVVELRSSDMAVTENFHADYVGGVDGEYPLHAAAVGNAADGEGLGDAAMLHGNDGALKHLVSFLVALADANRDADVVADLNGRLFRLQAGLADDLQCVHSMDPPKFSDIHACRCGLCRGLPALMLR